MVLKTTSNRLQTSHQALSLIAAVKMGKAEHKHMHNPQKTKNRTKDLDEIEEDMLMPEKTEKLLNQDVDFDLPGCGQNYCLHCA